MHFQFFCSQFLGRYAKKQQAVQAPTRLRHPKQPNRTTKISQKLVVFPDAQSSNQDRVITDISSDFGGDDDKQFVTQSPPFVHNIPYDVAKEKEAERIRRLDKHALPRVTAYCTAKYVAYQTI